MKKSAKENFKAAWLQLSKDLEPTIKTKGEAEYKRQLNEMLKHIKKLTAAAKKYGKLKTDDDVYNFSIAVIKSFYGGKRKVRVQYLN
ncbi:MAG: hypothetical protein KF900_14145 [Bacteroidetes bacterium]|nr:hypothetical protein [Bacteroidota bacterium]